MKTKLGLQRSGTYHWLIHHIYSDDFSLHHLNPFFSCEFEQSAQITAAPYRTKAIFFSLAEL